MLTTPSIIYHTVVICITKTPYIRIKLIDNSTEYKHPYHTQKMISAIYNKTTQYNNRCTSQDQLHDNQIIKSLFKLKNTCQQHYQNINQN